MYRFRIGVTKESLYFNWDMLIIDEIYRYGETMVNLWNRFTKKSRKRSTIPSDVADNEQLKQNYLASSLEENLQIIRQILSNCIDVVCREFYIGDQCIKAVLIYAEGLADKGLINSDILRALMLHSQNKKLTGSLVDAIKTIILPFADVNNITEISWMGAQSHC